MIIGGIIGFEENTMRMSTNIANLQCPNKK